MEVAESPKRTLTIRPYDKEDDYRMVLGWWRMHGGEEMMFALPPLGVIVEDDRGPAVALWCAEPAGFGCAYLELPISRPGLVPSVALIYFRMAVQSLIQIAGKCHEPPGEYRFFRAVTPAPLARMLMRLGFVQETPEPLIPMLFTRD
jgi:hypothetical protein